MTILILDEKPNSSFEKFNRHEEGKLKSDSFYQFEWSILVYHYDKCETK